MPAPVELSWLEAFSDLMKTVGFPVVVAGWFMFRLEKRLDALTDSVNRMGKK